MRSVEDKSRLGVVIMFGDDGVGLLHRAATFVTGHGGNVVKDKADIFETITVVITYFSASLAELEAMKRDTRRLVEETGTEVFVRSIERNGGFDGHERIPDRFRASSPDYQGLLSAITGALAELDVTIVTHEGEQYKDDLPNSRVRYKQRFVVRRPIGCSWRDLSQAISKLASERDVQWSPE